MDPLTEHIVRICLGLDEYQKKQLISCLVASMLTDVSNKQAKQSYNKIIKELCKKTK